MANQTVLLRMTHENDVSVVHTPCVQVVLYMYIRPLVRSGAAYGVRHIQSESPEFLIYSVNHEIIDRHSYKMNI